MGIPQFIIFACVCRCRSTRLKSSVAVALHKQAGTPQVVQSLRVELVAGL